MKTGKNYRTLTILAVAAIMLCCTQGAFAGDPISGAFRLVGRTVGGAVNCAADIAGGAVSTAGSIIHGTGRAVGNAIDAVVPG